jgi:secondary thiamine-phosphate synthase enzyme
MSVYTGTIKVSTRPDDVVDITPDVTDIIAGSKLRTGIACLFVTGSTGSVTTIEYEPGLQADMKKALDRLFPKNIPYQHHLRWGDGNGHSHIRASFLGPCLTVPFTDKRLELGTWQQIVFVEHDVRSRTREILVRLIGE